jgi:phosphomevalonate kinase
MTNTTQLAAIAPGKLMLSGEYVVLDGATALVTAVEVLARAHWLDPQAPLDPSHARPQEVVATELRAHDLGMLARESNGAKKCIAVDVDEFSQNGQKLGLGSSAAAAAATSAAYFLEAGRDLNDCRTDVFRLAFDGHRSVAPSGSGADVAASVFGGTLSIVKNVDYPQIDVVPWPAGLQASVVWTGASARTSELVEKVRALAERSPRHYRDRAAFALRSAAEDFYDAFVAADLYGIIDATEAHARGMSELGHLADAAIMTDTLGRIGLLAARHGGAAKPSGAGGGDVAVAFFASASDKSAFEQGCLDQGFAVLSLPVNARGVRSVEPQHALP